MIKRKDPITFSLIMSCITTATLWAGFLILMINLMGCNGGAVGDNSGGGGPPGPPTYDYDEVEPNDSFSTAQFVTLLPQGQSQEDIGGFIDLPDDLDYYYFFLSPNLGQDEVKFNVMVETDPFIAPRASLYQTIYDSLGVPTGDYQLIGTYVGINGNLIILDVAVPYHSFTNNDLFLLLEGHTSINGYKGYVIDFWSSL